MMKSSKSSKTPSRKDSKKAKPEDVCADILDQLAVTSEKTNLPTTNNPRITVTSTGSPKSDIRMRHRDLSKAASIDNNRWSYADGSPMKPVWSKPRPKSTYVNNNNDMCDLVRSSSPRRAASQKAPSGEAYNEVVAQIGKLALTTPGTKV